MIWEDSATYVWQIINTIANDLNKLYKYGRCAINVYQRKKIQSKTTNNKNEKKLKKLEKVWKKWK